MQTERDTPAREEAKEVIRAHRVIHGEYPSVIEAEKETGRSRIVIEPALAAVKAENAPLTITKKEQSQLRAFEKVLAQKLETEFEARVQAEYQKRVQEVFPDLKKIQDEARLTERNYRELIDRTVPLFTMAEYENLRFVCHPDNSASEERRNASFILLGIKKFQLTGRK